MLKNSFQAEAAFTADRDRSRRDESTFAAAC
jgi:hypothetical protein